MAGWPGLGATALGAVALWSGNNVLVLIAAPLWAVLVLAAVVGARNVRRLSIERRWPTELVAGRAGRGALVVVRARGSSHGLSIREEGTPSEASVVRVRGLTTVPFTWRFAERGTRRVMGFAVTSTWPFGLFEHTVRVPCPDEILVGVRPHPAEPDSTTRVGEGQSGEQGRMGTGDLVGLRAYAEGDALRRVHWPTSARVGSPMVVERAHDEQRTVIVQVEIRSTGPSWERELSRAAGRIQRAVRCGGQVGLAVPAVGSAEAATWAPRAGEVWRRHLLDVLARMPRVGP